MTANQIMKSLKNAGMNMVAVANASRGEVEIFVNNGNGQADQKKTKKAIKEAQAILGWKGGYYTGYGAMVLQESYSNTGNWNDKSSNRHY